MVEIMSSKIDCLHGSWQRGKLNLEPNETHKLGCCCVE